MPSLALLQHVNAAVVHHFNVWIDRATEPNRPAECSEQSPNADKSLLMVRATHDRPKSTEYCDVATRFECGSNERAHVIIIIAVIRELSETLVR